MYKELPESCMAFVLKTGETLLVHKEDVAHIAQMIIVEGSLKKTCTLIRESDKSIEKANMLYNILKAERDMSLEIRNAYLKQIGELLSSSDIKYHDMEGNEVTKPE